jgi:hypothetical protein
MHYFGEATLARFLDRAGASYEIERSKHAEHHRVAREPADKAQGACAARPVATMLQSARAKASIRADTRSRFVQASIGRRPSQPTRRDA